MNRFFIVLAMGIALTAGSCTKTESDDDDTIGNWVRRSDFEGVGRSEAISVTTGDDRVFVGLGYDGVNRLTDLWEYDAERNFWTKKKAFPGTARNSAVAFSVNNKVYVGLGYDGVNYLKDFWEYDPSTDDWTQLADFDGSARYGATAFSIGTTGYVCCGYDGNFLKDFWAFDGGTKTWTQKISPGGTKRNEPVSFVIGQKAYLVSGTNNGSNVNDAWVYDPTTDAWTEIRKISNVSDEDYDDDYNIVRSNAVAFALGGKGYITTGINGSYVSTTWEYDPTTDLWTLKTSFEGTAREGAVGFTSKGRAFVAIGRSASYRFDDCREFLPFAEYEEND